MFAWALAYVCTSSIVHGYVTFPIARAPWRTTPLRSPSRSHHPLRVGIENQEVSVSSTTVAATSSAPTTATLPPLRTVTDGRSFRVCDDDSALTVALVDRVAAISKAAIADHGAFYLSIG
jgi:arylamine N-acetyltransferase